MDSEIQTASSVQEKDTLRERAEVWALLEGDRRVVAAGIAIGFAGLIGALIWGGVLAVGPDSFAATLFGSGLTSGVVTLVTIALSINQLILSRVFGTPDVLTDRLEGARDLRQDVEELAGRPSTPTDPTEFLSMVAITLSDRTSNLLELSESTEWQPPAEVTNALHDFVEYGQSIDTSLGENPTVTDSLGVVLGPEYALNMNAVHHLRNEHTASLPDDVRTELEAIEKLFESIAIVRQFYKTIALQQDFATLSRLIVYSGMIALASAVSLTLLYRTGSTTLPPSILPIVVAAGIGVIVAPLALFASYILRSATIARQTTSVGPFIPPSER